MGAIFTDQVIQESGVESGVSTGCTPPFSREATGLWETMIHMIRHFFSGVTWGYPVFRFW